MDERNALIVNGIRDDTQILTLCCTNKEEFIVHIAEMKLKSVYNLSFV